MNEPDCIWGNEAQLLTGGKSGEGTGGTEDSGGSDSGGSDGNDGSE